MIWSDFLELFSLFHDVNRCTTSIGRNWNPRLIIWKYLLVIARNSLLIIAGNFLLFFVAVNFPLFSFFFFIKSKLIYLVGHDLCLLCTKLFDVELYLGSLVDIVHLTPIKLKSELLKIGCNLFMDSWRNFIEESPLNLKESRQNLTVWLNHDLRF